MSFRGQILVAGSAEGELLLLDEPLSLWGGLDPRTGEIIDRRHPQSGVCVSERVLAMPVGRGSSSASSILLEAVRLKTAPAALLLAELDPILVLGSTVARELYQRTVPITLLSRDDYAALTDGANIRIETDGTVTLFG